MTNPDYIGASLDRQAPRLPMLTTLFFDAAGTLIHIPRGVGWHYADVARRHGVNEEPAAWERAFRAAWSAAPPRETTRRPRPDDDRGWWRQLVESVLDALRIECDRDALFADMYARFAEPGVWELFPEAELVLQQLRSRYQLAVVSNFDRRLRRVLADLGVAHFFREIVLSSEIGADKPDPHIFEHALDLLGAAPGEVLHIGDDPIRDWQGAEKSGLQVFRLRRPANSLRDLPLP